MPCHGICGRYKAEVARYIPGKTTKCRTCMKFLNWIGLYCPCCGMRVAIGPRNGKMKEKFKERFGPKLKRIEA